MKLTEELLKENLENTVKNIDGFKQGYASALQWVASLLKEEENKTVIAEETK